MTGLSSGPCDGHIRSLLEWYTANARDLPWRKTRDPYRIWISEIMLQQTQVATVLPRYQPWFAHFPDIASLAMALEDAVLKAWEGLGYYRRARLLHISAKHIVAEHGGNFPQEFDDILRLSGIGRSTAGAIASFCFDERTPVLDGNVKRVLRRWHGRPDAAEKELWQLAQQYIDDSRKPGDWNQSMMELGATICASFNPGCANCPVNRYCASAFETMGSPDKRKPIRVRDVHWRVHLHVDGQHGLWLTRRPATGIWAGLWAPPITELAGIPDESPAHIHLLTHRRLHLYAEVSAESPCGDGQWVADIERVALPTGIRRMLAKCGAVA